MCLICAVWRDEETNLKGLNRSIFLIEAPVQAADRYLFPRQPLLTTSGRPACL